MTTEPHPIPWLEWGADAFVRAVAEQKPVLLAIGAAWCRWTEEMDRVSYRDPAVVRLVTERFIPIRIDADRRPDVSERYTLGGWPTTAFLTPTGDILGGGTYLEPGPLVHSLGTALRSSFVGFLIALIGVWARARSGADLAAAGEAAAT